MTLQAQFRLAAFLTAAAVLLVLATLWLTSLQLSRALAESTFAGSLNAGGISGLRTVTIEYVLNPGQRPRLQWWQRHQSLAAMLERSPFDSAAEQAQLASVRLRHQYLAELFPKLTDLLESNTEVAESQHLTRQVESRLVAQILVATEDMVSESRRLLEQNLLEVKQAEKRAGIIISTAVLGLGMLMAVGFVLAMQGVIRPIRALQASAELIGSGRLEHRTRIALGNEIGDLSRAFDQMAVRLAASRTALQARTAELETANQELESFSYSVSHDLRAPLRGIDGWSLALVEDLADKLDERTRPHLQFIRAEAQRMGQLIDDLLMLSRVSRQDLVRDRVDLSQLASVIAARMAKEHASRSIQLIVQSGMQALADARLLDIVLTNLLDNACKFTCQSASARIEVKRAQAGEGKAFPDQAVFCVCDNGVGFDMAHAGKLFGAFQRLHRTSEFPGTGIGLATVQRIVHRHGGTVWAEAAPGSGAKFYFSLPEAP